MALKLLLRLLHGLMSVGRSLQFFFSYALIKPLIAVVLFIFRTFLVPLYRLYFVLKKWLLSIFAPAKNKIIYPLLNKSTIHLVIVVITLAVIANNFHIKEIQAEEFSQKTILAVLTVNEEEETITETAVVATKVTTQNGASAGVLAVRPAFLDSGGTTQVMTSESSGAVVKPDLASTAVGDRPREQVEYYLVQGGDTISTIAEKFGISANTVLWENKLGPRDYIKPGDKLTILPQSGVSHQVKKGDTLEKIAQRYSVETNAIIEYNKLVDASAIEPDEILIIPDGAMPEEPKPQIRQPTGSRLGILEIPPPSRVSSSARLLWPTTSRKINQYFRWRHTGIDIEGDYSSPVYAAEDGRVEQADSRARGYGLHIVINHGGGLKTLYSHESKLLVRAGDSVKRGQVIGMIGCTGWCTGPHVHFEVIINGKKVNPLSYL